MGRIYEDLTKTIGNTPLVKLNRVTKGIDATIVVKLESFNPLSSVKDRIGVSMIDAAERAGHIKPTPSSWSQPVGTPELLLLSSAPPRATSWCWSCPKRCRSSGENCSKPWEPTWCLTPGSQGMKGAMSNRRRDAGQGPSLLLHSPAVQKSVQSGDPSQDHCRGDLARYRRKGRHTLWQAWAPVEP